LLIPAELVGSKEIDEFPSVNVEMTPRAVPGENETAATPSAIDSNRLPNRVRVLN
jgi:hypothetical protein